MGYCICYDKTTGAMEIKKYRKTKKKMLAITLVTAVFAAALLVPQVRQGLKFLLPGDEAVTAQALEDLAAALHQGEPVSEAVEAFCREIIANE